MYSHTNRNLSLAVAALVAVAAEVRAQTFVWTGAGADTNWSSSANWDTGAPTSGASTVVAFNTATQPTTTNDLAGGLTLNSLTFGTGAGARTVNGNALIFSGTSPTLVSQSTGAGDVRIAAPITLNQTLSVTGGPSFDAQLLFVTGGGFSGTGGLIWTGGVGFNNVASTFSGPVQIQGGVFGTNVATGLGSNVAASVAAGGTLQLQNGASINKALSLAGAGFESHGALEAATGGGAWSGAITLAANATVGAINPIVGATNTNTLTISGGVGLGANTLTANVSSGGGVTISGAVTGTGGITKTGVGTLMVLSSGSNYTGPTLISAGSATVAHANGFGASSLVTVSPGATLFVNGVTVARPLSLAGQLSASGISTNAWSGAITLAGNATLSATGGSASNVTLGINGGIALNGATLTLAPEPAARNIVSLNSAVTGTGAVNVVTGSGAVVFDGGGASTFTGPVGIDGKITLGLGDNFGNLANTVTFNGGSVVSFNNNATISARPWVMSGAGGLTLVPSNLSHTIGASITGTGPLTVTSIGLGTGGLVMLSGTNTFTGGLVVGASSTVRASADAALGATGGAITLAGGGLSFVADFTLSSARSVEITSANGTITAPAGVVGTVASNLTGAGRLTVGGGSGGNIGGTVTFTGTNTQSGGIVLNGATLALDSDARLGGATGVFNITGNSEVRATGAFTVAATRSTTFSNLKIDTNGFDVVFAQSLTGTGIEKNGAGVLRFDAANASTASNFILLNTGTLRAGVANAFGTGANLSTTAGTVFDLNNFNQSIVGISGDGAVQLGSGTLTLRSGALLGGAISGTGAVVLEGGGSFLFNGSNSFSGGLTVRQSAALLVNSVSAFGIAGGSITLDDGELGTSGYATAPVTLDASVPFTIGSGGAQFSASGQSLVIASALGGTAPISFSGGASGYEVRLTNAANTFVSNLQIGTRSSDAVLGIVANGSLGATSNVLTLGDRFYDGESTQTSRGTLRAFASFTLPATRTIRLNGNGSNGGGEIDTNGFAVTIDGAITQLNAGNVLRKTGAGTLLLNGANTFTGAMEVLDGTLSGNGSLAGRVSVGAGATIAPGASAGLLTIAGNLTLLGGSFTTLEIGGVTRGVGGYDAFDIGGTFSPNGTLTVSLINGFNPVSGTSFTLFNAGAFSGDTFETLNLPVLTDGLTWNSSQLLTLGTLSVTGSAIPEPGTWALIAGGCGLIVALLRRRRAAGRA